MRAPPQQRRLADGRLHLHDGPIDLIIEAFGGTSDVEGAYAAAQRRFVTILDELCVELPLLRADPGGGGPAPRGPVARRMAAAVASFHARRFVTPMAAVAGAVAEEILEAMTSGRRLARAYVNDGGDIALYLGPGETFSIGMVDRPGLAKPVRPRYHRSRRPRPWRRDVGLARAKFFRSASPTRSRSSRAPLRSPTPRRH